MVVVASALDAHGVPRADPAVVDRLWIGVGGAVRRSVGDPRIEPSSDVSEVGGEVVSPVRVPHAISRYDVQPLGRQPLETLEQVRVDAHLEDRATLDRARQLGIGDVVAPAAEHRARAVRPLEQEVGMSAPPPVEECGLEDDVGAGSHRVEGGRLGRPQVVWSSQVLLGDLDDGEALGSE